VKVQLGQELRLHQRFSQRPLRLNRDHGIDRVTVGKDSHAVAGVVAVVVVNLAGKASTITVKKSLRPNSQMIPNSLKQNHVL
jgi:hypothetical protein